MEGVIDFHVRQLLTALNPFDYCVTEFARVTSASLSRKTLLRLAPELDARYQSNTKTKTSVRVQLLGQNPIALAESAALALELGSFGLDLNCGCPAKTVVGHQGGAFLLQYPELIHQIVAQIRAAIGHSAVLSVKIRLGWEDKSQCTEIASAIEAAGATELAVHGRTKKDGYQADKIDWRAIGDLTQKIKIPIIANGEIFNPEDAQQCMQQAKTQDLMLGRGILSSPNLAAQIKHQSAPLPWISILNALIHYASIDLFEQTRDKPFYHSARIKQWLSYLKRQYPEAESTFYVVRRAKTQTEIQIALQKTQSDLMRS